MVQVADRRRWQSAMTSPIGDVGSERVKVNFKFVSEGGGGICVSQTHLVSLHFS